MTKRIGNAVFIETEPPEACTSCGETKECRPARAGEAAKQRTEGPRKGWEMKQGNLKRLQKLWAWALCLLQRRCPHKRSWVVADVLEGAGHPQQVRWCRACGAVGIACCAGDRPEMRLPRPDWAVDP